MSLNWMHFPQSTRPSELSLKVVASFSRVHEQIDSLNHSLPSNAVLQVVAPELKRLGFRVESGKSKRDKISVPVFYGMNGKVEKGFDADAHHDAAGYVLEVEAGRGVTNNQFLKDLFQACVMDGVAELCIAVRSQYKGQRDFSTVCMFMQTLFASTRLALPLRGVLVVGY